jgi:hypothetical protein
MAGTLSPISGQFLNAEDSGDITGSFGMKEGQNFKDLSTPLPWMTGTHQTQGRLSIPMSSVTGARPSPHYQPGTLAFAAT